MLNTQDHSFISGQYILLFTDQIKLCTLEYFMYWADEKNIEILHLPEIQVF